MKLIDQVRHQARVRHLAYRTEQSYVQWIVRFLRHHRDASGWRHPAEMGAAEVEQFLTYLAVQGQLAASTQNQALVSTARCCESTWVPSTRFERGGRRRSRWCFPCPKSPACCKVWTDSRPRSRTD